MGRHPPDRRLSLTQLSELYPRIEFVLDGPADCDQPYADASAAGSETGDQIAARGQRLLDWLVNKVCR